MINFSIYRSWEPYHVVPEHSLVDSIDKDSLQDSACYGIYCKHSSLLLKRKCDWYIANNIQQIKAKQRHFRKKKSSKSG
jgi:hypothetical protein